MFSAPSVFISVIWIGTQVCVCVCGVFRLSLLFVLLCNVIRNECIYIFCLVRISVSLGTVFTLMKFF